MIYAICAACGGYLDRDDPTCRQCGENNDAEAVDDSPLLEPGLDLDRLGQWSHAKHEILTNYATEYAKILGEQKRKQNIRRFSYIEGFAGAGVAVDKATGDYIAGSALLALDISPKFDEYHFIELDDRKAGILERLTAGVPGVTVHRGDSNIVLQSAVLPRCKWSDYARDCACSIPTG
jgi:hypothetical protein